MSRRTSLRLLPLLLALLLLPVAPAAAVTTPPLPDYGPTIDAYARYEPETGCYAPKVWPGTQRLRDFFDSAWPGHTFLLDRPCSSADSGHEEGRSIDFMLDSRTKEGWDTAQSVLDWLGATDRYGNAHAMVRRTGIMYIIWNSRMWRAYDPGRGWTEYAGCLTTLTDPKYDTTCHRNHIHISLSWAGAKAQTSFYTGPVGPPCVEGAAGCPLSRLAGADRYATSVAIGRRAFPSSTTVVIASGESSHLVDGLVAAPLGYKLHAPVLLGTAGGLPPSVLDDVVARKATRAVLVGSADVLGPQVVDQLVRAGIPAAAIDRIGGGDRYQTAAQVAAQVGGTAAVVASGDDGHLVDALAAGGPASRLGWPILLTAATSLPPSTASALQGRSSVVVVGDSGVVGPDVVKALPSGAVRLGGADRYATAVAVASHFAGQVGASQVVLGSGGAAHLVDALPGGALGELTVLSDPSVASAATLQWLGTTRPGDVTIVGGTPAVSNAVATAVYKAVTG